MTNQRSPVLSLLDLPSELLLKIFSDVLAMLDIQAEAKPFLLQQEQRCKATDSPEFNEHPRNMPPHPVIYQITSVPSLVLVSKYTRELLSKLVWESHVRFLFPSTIALMDVLLAPSQQHRIPRLRRVSFYHTPFPFRLGNSDSGLFPYGANFAMALLKGLQLDLLEVKTIGLSDNGAWARRQIVHEMKGWMRTFGWRELRFSVEQLYLQEHEVIMLATTTVDLRTDRQEFDFAFDLPTTPVLRSEKTGHIVGLMVDGDHDSRMQTYMSRYWGRFRNPGTGEDAECVARMVCKRGADAEYVQLDEEDDAIASLNEALKTTNWIEMRKSGFYTMYEAVDDQ